jgi:hypothetical protein
VMIATSLMLVILLKIEVISQVMLLSCLSKLWLTEAV